MSDFYQNNYARLLFLTCTGVINRMKEVPVIECHFQTTLNDYKDRMFVILQENSTINCCC